MLRVPAAGVHKVLRDQIVEQLLVFFRRDRLQLDHAGIAALLEFFDFVQHKRHAPRHACREIAAGPAEHHDHAAGHVLAAVIAGPFDDGTRAAVPHGKPLTRHAIEIGFALRRAIERRVADENRLFRVKRTCFGGNTMIFPPDSPLPM